MPRKTAVQHRAIVWMISSSLYVFALLAVTQANGAIIVDRYGPGDTYNPSGSRSTQWFPGAVNDVAQMFTVQGGDVALDTIELQLRGGSADVIVVVSRDDVAGKEPGYNPGLLFAPDPAGVLDTFHISALDLDGNFPGKMMTLKSVTNPILASGENYWLYLTTPINDEGRTAWLSSILTDRVVIGERYNKLLWDVSAPRNGFAFRVTGFAVPEPSSILCFIGVALAGASFPVRRRLSRMRRRS